MPEINGIDWYRNDADGVSGQSPNAHYHIDRLTEGYTLTIQLEPGWTSEVLYYIASHCEETLNTKIVRKENFIEPEEEEE